ncbi:30S ribosomal protein S30e [Candidatus Bathyarchaeota archaeon]|nr:30S ribosomal protein S30e [Candidatus Bathyarchaeota archaeon]MBT4321410.1 30S ribosomal protein S30e [Candidatus Bathyarchaeota archaeon]MBT4423816.1 30S ribosomal protein S30e [Candidatus Bathyarchaeota archaeon]MBT5642033.1 30S ribosomal protein S30e [Candidatus Bathyarchaeota archaeon]MBT6605127.1 30S ribosomal protein S30e [Candidatus Bathyarchaeota archaeon]
MPTHGSLTKAGKVRAQTPKVDAMERTGLSPRKRMRSNYSKRIANVPLDRWGNRPRKRRR